MTIKKNINLFACYSNENKFMLSIKYSIFRTIFFTCGHFAIDMSISYIVTGTTIQLAALTALLSPTLNAAWYFLLDRILFGYLAKKAIKVQ